MVASKNKKHVPSLLEFNAILDRTSHEDTIGHLFIVDNKFHNINEKTLLFNEIYPPIFEKNKKMEPFEKSTAQLMSNLVRDEEKDTINSFRYNSKTHSTLQSKKYFPLYAEHLHFLIKSVGWLVTHIYKHFTFEQSKFKKDFVVMNQKAGQKATCSVERDFYKLLNNSNFGIDFRNNIDNCILEPLYDQVAEISYIKKFCTIVCDNTYRDFFSPTVMREEIRSEYNSKLLSPDKMTLPTRREEYLNNKMDEDLDSVDFFEQKLKRGRGKKNLNT